MLQLAEEDWINHILVLTAPGLAPPPRLAPFLILGLGLRGDKKFQYIQTVLWSRSWSRKKQKLLAGAGI
jgi:hypothetical protein